MDNTQGYRGFADLSSRIHSIIICKTESLTHTLLLHIKEYRDAMAD